jgi:adenosylcobinamide-phosphate guanylyltransferase
MFVIVMAGGRGDRLNMGEKSLVSLLNRPLLEWALHSCREALFPFLVATSKYTPYTANYCRIHGYPQFQTQGNGYISDLVEVLATADVTGPVMTITSDLAGLRGYHLQLVENEYQKAGEEACSVWVLQRLCVEHGFSYSYIEEYHGEQIVPAGINVLDGFAFDREQKEFRFVTDDPSFACNINNPSDLLSASRFLNSPRLDPARRSLFSYGQGGSK